MNTLASSRKVSYKDKMKQRINMEKKVRWMLYNSALRFTVANGKMETRSGESQHPR